MPETDTCVPAAAADSPPDEKPSDAEIAGTTRLEAEVGSGLKPVLQSEIETSLNARPGRRAVRETCEARWLDVYQSIDHSKVPEPDPELIEKYVGGTLPDAYKNFVFACEMSSISWSRAIAREVRKRSAFGKE